MTAKYAPGAENARRTHMNAIERVERFSLSERFKTLNAIDLDARMELFKESFANFTETHQKLVSGVSDASRFGSEDEFFSQIESKYQATIIRFRTQIAKVEKEDILKSMAQRSREKLKERNLSEHSDKSEIKQRQQQQQQQRRIEYEMELRHQRIVHQNDMVMHQQRTREWVNDVKRHQPLGEWDEMERTKRQIEQRYNDLERRHQALSEQLDIVTRHQQANERVHAADRERSRSPQRQTHSQAVVRMEEERQLVQINSTVHRTPGYDLRNVLVRKKGRECHFCRENHVMRKCPTFLALNVAEREQHVHVLDLCENCFMPIEGGRHRCQFGHCWNCGPNHHHNSLLCPNAKK